MEARRSVASLMAIAAAMSITPQTYHFSINHNDPLSDVLPDHLNKMKHCRSGSRERGINRNKHMIGGKLYKKRRK